MESEDFSGLEVVRVRERTETKFGKGDKVIEIVVHAIVIAKKDGLKITLQQYENPFPWKIGDPITLTVKSTQTHLGVE